MLRVALKGLRGHGVRFVLTALAVVIGVAFIAGTFVLTDGISRGFDELFTTAYSRADLYVRAASPVSPIGFEQGSAPVDEQVVDRVAAVEGVGRAVGSVSGPARVAGPDGEPLGGPGAPSFGSSWTDVGNPLTLREGRPPEGPGEITVDVASAAAGGVGIGEQLTVVTDAGPRRMTVVGLTGFGASDSLMGATVITMAHETAQELFGKAGRVDDVAVVAAAGVEVPVLRERVAQALGGSFTVATAQQRAALDQEQIDPVLDVLNTALLVFGAVALLVAAFLIANTFSIVVAQRTREFALLRAVGASQAQVRAAVLVEAAGVGLVASLVGLAAGLGLAVGLRELLAAFGLQLPSAGLVLRTRTVALGLGVGMGVSLLAAWPPARRAARVPPVQALRRTAVGEEAPAGRRRTLAGVGLAAAGTGLLLAGLLGGVGEPLEMLAAGGLVAVLGVALLAPAVVDPLARTLGAVPARLSTAGLLAQRNAQRSPRRTAATASALMIGLAMVAFVAVVAASLRAGTADALTAQFAADLVVSPESFGGGPQGMPDRLVDDLRRRPEVGAVTPVMLAGFVRDGEQHRIAGVDTAQVGELLELGAAGTAPDQLGPREVLVDAELTEAGGVAVGETIAVEFATGPARLQVAGTFTNSELLGASYLLPAGALRELAGSPTVSAVYLDAADGVEPARAAVEAVADEYPGTAVRNQAEFRQQQDEAVNQVLALTVVLLAFALLIALLGVTNTLALAVAERTREIGLLRAVGMLRRQVGRMVLWESVIIAALGALLGIAVGLVFGWAAVRALTEEGIGRLVVPGPLLAGAVLAACLAGLAAALAPAWRAGRLNVLEAISAE